MSNIYIRRKYCDKCGSPTKEVPVESFDTATGEPNTRDICTNKSCVDNCDFYNRHRLSLFGRCKICGYKEGQYL